MDEFLSEGGEDEEEDEEALETHREKRQRIAVQQARSRHRPPGNQITPLFIPP
jgi:hypothetical protein